jgi:hypothetical protein
MKLPHPALLVSVLLALGTSSTFADDPVRSKPIDFDRDIRPILSENCYACHGPDANKRKAKLRLDTKQGAFADLGGHFAIVAGKPEESELVSRVESDDPDEKMPPPNGGTGKTLTKAQIDLLRRWVASGAEFRGHWAYEKPVKFAPPAAGAGHEIDRFLRAKLVEKGLKPSPSADKVTLIRRLSFDLTGLPPTPSEVDAFVADTSPDAYEKLVDCLLGSPHYGERMAMAWLDFVRYADTAGYHSDNHREVSLYRDYVIDAFNKNKPFDAFTIEQLAGDLIQNPTDEQRIASGYNRMLMTTQEGGGQAKEYIAKYAADRVRNASTVWLGATLGCAECHDHKFDPFTQKDFYRFAAFFADVQEVPIGEQPVTRFPTPAQKARVAEFDAKIGGLRKVLGTTTPALAAEQAAFEDEARRAGEKWANIVPTSARSQSGSPLKIEADGTIFAQGDPAESEVYFLKYQVDRRAITAFRLEAIPDDKLPSKGPGRAPNGNFVINEFAVTVGDKPVALTNASATFAQPGFDPSGAIDDKPKTGWAVAGRTGRASEAVFETKADLGGSAPLSMTIQLVQQYGSGHVLGKFRIAVSERKRPVRAGGPDAFQIREEMAIPLDKRTKAQAEAVATYYRGIAPSLEPTRSAVAALIKEKENVLASAPTMLVSTSGQPRTVRVMPRGNWLDESGPEVTPAVPGFLGPEVKGRRANRLDLANWLVSSDNPLVARVFVNRLWKLAFGQGLVTSIEDFGSQGASPTHPELLDWLATTFRDEGWNVKSMLKRIVMSESYRQTSTASESLRQADPYNQWLARQTRYRLEAEAVRDDMLVVSGLLVPKVGGPSVKPYQPAGYWSHLNFPKREYQNDHGEGLYRRGLYTYWMRSFLHPSLLAFDAPSREECTAQRARSNTPLQALVLLNDPIYVEGARAFAERTLKEGGKEDDARLTFAYKWAVSRSPRPAERDVLVALLKKHRDYFRSHAKEAEDLIHVGEHPAPKDVETAELAAWTSVARAVLNLHETITRN